MQWKSLSSAEIGENSPCQVCGGAIVESAQPVLAFRPDFVHGDTPGSVEFLQERHKIDISDEQGVTCEACRARVDDLLK